MKYSKAISPFIILSVIVIILLLYFKNLTREIEKENNALINQINLTKEQLNINEIEFSIYNSYEYLSQMQKLYFKETNTNNLDKRISFNDLVNNNLNNFVVVGIR